MKGFLSLIALLKGFSSWSKCWASNENIWSSFKVKYILNSWFNDWGFCDLVISKVSCNLLFSLPYIDVKSLFSYWSDWFKSILYSNWNTSLGSYSILNLYNSNSFSCRENSLVFSTAFVAIYVLSICSSSSFVVDEWTVNPEISNPLSLLTVKLVAVSLESIDFALLLFKLPNPARSEPIFIEVPVLEFKFPKPPENL